MEAKAIKKPLQQIIKHMFEKLTKMVPTLSQNLSKIDPGGALGLIFGSPNGGQGHQKATSKKHQKHDAQNEPKLVPKGFPKWSPNRSK